MKRAINLLAVIFMIVGTIGALQVVAAQPASAGSVPPPDYCLHDDFYDYANPDCWGDAGNPPKGCIQDDGTVLNRPDCLEWKAKVPAPPHGGHTHCGKGYVEGPLNTCCLPSDQACLNGSIQTPQGSKEALELAKKICEVLPSLPHFDPRDMPYQCTLPQPTLEAGAAACTLGISHSGYWDGLGNIFWGLCTKFEIIIAGQIPPFNPPLAGDPAFAKQMCEFDIQMKIPDTPPGCSKPPVQVQDGVLACRALLLADIDLFNKFFGNKCLDLVTRNPANVGALDPTKPPQHVEFNDTNIKKITQGLDYFALALCIGGVMFSGILWISGAKESNEGQQHTGKRGLIVCLVAAMILGALPSLFKFYDKVSRQADDNAITGHN